MICAKADAHRTIKISPKSSTDFTQLLQPNDLDVSRHFKVHVNYAKNVLERPTILKLLVLGLLIKLNSPLIDVFKNVSFS